MADLEERILEDTDLQPRIWWRYIDDIFFIWEHGEDFLKQFIETLNAFHSTVQFTSEWSREEINFLYVNVRLRNRQLERTYISNQLTLISFLARHLVIHSKKSIPYSQALRYNRI